MLEQEIAFILSKINDRRLNIRKMCRETKVSYQTVYNLRNGTYDPKLSTVKKLHDYITALNLGD